MSNLNILLLDDDIRVIQDFQRTIELFNIKREDIRIEVIYHSSACLNEISELIKPSLNGIIIDMKWNGDDYFGEKIATIAKEYMIPVVIFSGNSYEMVENDFYKFIPKEQGAYTILEHFVSLHDTKFNEIFSTEGILFKELLEIFWSHAANDILEWNKIEPKYKVNRLIRYVVSRLTHKYSLNIDTRDKSDEFSPSEYYINPNIREKPYSGTIIKNLESQKRYIIINASCDMERELPDFITVCELDEQIRSEYQSKYHASNSNGKKSIKDKFNNMIKNSNQRFHFLPEYSSIKESFIDFQKIISIENKKIVGENQEYIIEYSVTPDIFKDIQYRFSHYYARQGQPDLDNLFKIEVSKLS